MDDNDGNRRQRGRKQDSGKLTALELLKKARQGEKISYEVKDDDLFEYVEGDELDDYYDDYDDNDSKNQKKSKKNKKKTTKRDYKDDYDDDDDDDGQSESKSVNRFLTKQKVSTNIDHEVEKTHEIVNTNKDIRSVFANASKIKQKTTTDSDIKPKFHTASNEDDIIDEIMQELNTKTVINSSKKAASKPKLAVMNAPPTPTSSSKRKLSPHSTETIKKDHERPVKRLELDDNLIEICQSDEFLNDNFCSSNNNICMNIKQEKQTPVKANIQPNCRKIDSTTIKMEKLEIKQEVCDNADLEDIELLSMLSIHNLTSSNKVDETALLLQQNQASTSSSSIANTSSQCISNTTLVQAQIDDTELKTIKTRLESSKDLFVYWFDAHEDIFGNPGCVYFFGKMQIPDKQDAYLSVCCIIKNIPRILYVLPRKYRVDRKTKQVNKECGEVTMNDVNSEIDQLMDKYKIFNYRTKIVEKNFAFDSNYDVPYHSEYLKIEYSADMPALSPNSIEGETFECIFGLNTSFLETLLLDLKLKGPCWLQISNAKRCDDNQSISWCKLEYTIDNYKQISICKELTSAKLPTCPPLTSLTFIVKTALNKKTQEHEIICACGLVNHHFYLDKTASSTSSNNQIPLYDSYFCALTKPSNSIFPFDFNNIIQNLQNKFKIEICSSERALLAYVLCKIHSFDADIIIGHDLFGYNFDILLNRCFNKKVPHWSRLGRLKRNNIPKHISTQRIQLVCSGRLLCDIMLSAKELLNKIKSYDLNELVLNVLKETYQIEQEQDYEKNIYNYYNTSQLLLKLIRLIMLNATYIYRICNDLNAIQLAYQLTCIAGNVLSRTLIGGRSERNEYLLLHAFYDKDFILPDKVYNTNRNFQGQNNNKSSKVQPLKEYQNNTNFDNMDDDGNNDDNELSTQKSSNQAAKNGKTKSTSYTGGLVLEPKVGFYDHFILLLDFNSLYPSIIQEYNICFTTIQRPNVNNIIDLDEYLETSIKLPTNDDKPGILPSEIRKLVDSRRQVKQLLQKENLNSELKMQYDIRQKALKLTANSMYGCLGFEHSRFYCKPLAALITRFGRNILMKTKDLVEGKKIEVIYGDTDSIMINTNLNDYDQVIKLGNLIRVDVNKLYKHLEIGIDGVFKCLLLLKKKKYAALCIDGKNPKDQTQLITHQEVKGLDIVRRDWCTLAKQVGEQIISQILSGANCDLVIQNINKILYETADKVNKNMYDLTLFEINKQLNRNPEEYNDSNHQSHVQVALRLNSDASNTKKIRSGDVVSYIICDDGTQNSATQRAYARSEIENNKFNTGENNVSSSSGAGLRVDIKYYLSQQIHPIVSRLCEPIEGIDAVHIATCLGLDSSNFKHKSSSSSNGTSSLQINTTLSKQQQKLQMYLNEAEKYKNCVPFKYTCPSCKTETMWKELFVKNEETLESKCILDACSNISCTYKPVNCLAYIKNSLTKQINTFIRQYYQFWLTCEDSICAHRTKRLSSKFTNYKPNCIECDRYTTSLEYTHADLYNQMRYLKFLFDADSHKNLYRIDTQLNSDLNLALKDLKEFVTHRLKRNSYGTVNLKALFNNL